MNPCPEEHGGERVGRRGGRGKGGERDKKSEEERREWGR